MTRIRCKFRCDSVEKRKGWDPKVPFVYTAHFSPVYSSDPQHENKVFWDATPAGKLEVGTVKEAPFEPGMEYYIDISPAEASKP